MLAACLHLTVFLWIYLIPKRTQIQSPQSGLPRAMPKKCTEQIYSSPSGWLLFFYGTINSLWLKTSSNFLPIPLCPSSLSFSTAGWRVHFSIPNLAKEGLQKHGWVDTPQRLDVMGEVDSRGQQCQCKEAFLPSSYSTFCSIATLPPRHLMAVYNCRLSTQVTIL